MWVDPKTRPRKVSTIKAQSVLQCLSTRICQASESRTSTLCDLDILTSWPSKSFYTVAAWTTCGNFQQNRIHPLWKYSVHMFGNGPFTDGRTDERTDGQVENSMPPDSLGWRRNTRNLAIANRPRVSCAHNTPRASIVTDLGMEVMQGSPWRSL